MLSSNVLNPQFLSPIWCTGVNVALRRKHRCKKITEVEEKQRDSNGNNIPSIKIPFLPSYLDRMMPLASYLSSGFKLPDSNNVQFDKKQSLYSYLPVSFFSPWSHQPIRTFKTARYTSPNEEKRFTKEGRNEEQKDVEYKSTQAVMSELSDVIKEWKKEKPASDPKRLRNWIVDAALIGSIIFVASFLYRNRTGSFGKSTEDVGTTTNVTFEDVRGADEVKAELTDIVEFLKNPKKFTDVGAKLPRGILLVGPPGTGKTLLAKAVAGEAGVTFFYASGSEFDELLVGMGALRVRQLFEKARKRAPSIIFLDEIDACGGKRASTALQPYARQTINQLLQEMDGFTENDTVVVLAATNDSESLDRALVRPGRFDTTVQVVPPDIDGRKEILKLYLDKLHAVSHENLNLDRLCSLTIGMTGADLSNIVNQAALRSVKLSKPSVDQEDLEFALDKIRMGPELKTRIKTDEELRKTAYHEAGHALVAYYTPCALDIYKATIVQRGPALGHVSLIPSRDNENMTSKSALLAGIDVSMGGRVAEELIYGKDYVSTGAASDIQGATKAAYEFVCVYGMSETMGTMTYNLDQLSPETKRTVELEVKSLLEKSREKARKLLTSKAFEHKLLAQALLRYESLSVDEIKLLLESKDIDKVGLKRDKDNEEKMRKKLEVSGRKNGLDITAPVIDYIPAPSDSFKV